MDKPLKREMFFYVAGGTGGSVSPILAVAEEIKKLHPESLALFVGGSGIEKKMAEDAGMEFVSIPAGKWRRYWSLRNILTPFQLTFGFIKSWYLISKYKPCVVFGTGSFAQVPLMYAAAARGVPVIIHQQDVVPGLANKLCAYFARKITVTFEKSLSDFSQGLWL